MKTSITNSGIMNQLEDTLRIFVKENLERVMKEELTQVLDVEHPEANSTKNETYKRQLDKRYGRVSLRIPRDRKGIFQAPVFQPYRRREG
jgi:transposase-like protein